MTDREILEVTKAEIKRLAKVGHINGAVFDETRNEKGIWLQQADVCERILSFINSKQEEPVSEDLEKIAELYTLDDSMKPWRNLTKEAFIGGAKWQKANDESVTQDLGEYINELSKQFPEVSFAKLSRISVRVAKWQKEQIKKAMDLGEPPYLISIEQAYYRTLKLLEE